MESKHILLCPLIKDQQVLLVQLFVMQIDAMELEKNVYQYY